MHSNRPNDDHTSKRALQALARIDNESNGEEHAARSCGDHVLVHTVHARVDDEVSFEVSLYLHNNGNDDNNDDNVDHKDVDDADERRQGAIDKSPGSSESDLGDNEVRREHKEGPPESLQR